VITTYLILITIILISLWNGYVIRWKHTGVKKYSTIWHIIGFFVRLCLVAIIYIQSGWLWALIGGFICWIPYNMLINVVNKWPVFYIGTTSKIDLFIRKIFKL